MQNRLRLILKKDINFNKTQSRKRLKKNYVTKQPNPETSNKTQSRKRLKKNNVTEVYDTDRSKYEKLYIPLSARTDFDYPYSIE